MSRLKPWKKEFFHSHKFSSVDNFIEHLLQDKVLHAYLRRNIYDHEGLQLGTLEYKISPFKASGLEEEYRPVITTKVSYGLTIIGGVQSSKTKIYFLKEPVIHLPEEEPVLSDKLLKVDEKDDIPYNNYPSLSELVKKVNTTLKRPAAHVENITSLYA